MGFLKRLFSKAADSPSVVKADAPPAPARYDSGRPQVTDGPADWPVDPKTGQVFDDEWLLTGLKAAVNDNQFQAAMYGRDASASQRRERLYEIGLDGRDQRQAMLRGRDWLEWAEHVHQMKREGHLEPALGLVYEMIEVSTKSELNDTVPPGWYRHAAILHRKLRDPDGEIRIMKKALLDYPGDEDFQKRLDKAQELKAKAKK